MLKRFSIISVILILSLVFGTSAFAVNPPPGGLASPTFSSINVQDNIEAEKAVIRGNLNAVMGFFSSGLDVNGMAVFELIRGNNLTISNGIGTGTLSASDSVTANEVKTTLLHSKNAEGLAIEDVNELTIDGVLSIADQVKFHAGDSAQGEPTRISGAEHLLIHTGEDTSFSFDDFNIDASFQDSLELMQTLQGGTLGYCADNFSNYDCSNLTSEQFSEVSGSYSNYIEDTYNSLDSEGTIPNCSAIAELQMPRVEDYCNDTYGVTCEELDATQTAGLQTYFAELATNAMLCFGPVLNLFAETLGDFINNFDPTAPALDYPEDSAGIFLDSGPDLLPNLIGLYSGNVASLELYTGTYGLSGDAGSALLRGNVVTISGSDNVYLTGDKQIILSSGDSVEIVAPLIDLSGSIVTSNPRDTYVHHVYGPWNNIIGTSIGFDSDGAAVKIKDKLEVTDSISNPTFEDGVWYGVKIDDDLEVTGAFKPNIVDAASLLNTRGDSGDDPVVVNDDLEVTGTFRPTMVDVAKVFNSRTTTSGGTSANLPVVFQDNLHVGEVGDEKNLSVYGDLNVMTIKHPVAGDDQYVTVDDDLVITGSFIPNILDPNSIVNTRDSGEAEVVVNDDLPVLVNDDLKVTGEVEIAGTVDIAGGNLDVGAFTINDNKILTNSGWFQTTFGTVASKDIITTTINSEYIVNEENLTVGGVIWGGDDNLVSINDSVDITGDLSLVGENSDINVDGAISAGFNLSTSGDVISEGDSGHVRGEFGDFNKLVSHDTDGDLDVTTDLDVDGTIKTKALDVEGAFTADKIGNYYRVTGNYFGVAAHNYQLAAQASCTAGDRLVFCGYEFRQGCTGTHYVDGTQLCWGTPSYASHSLQIQSVDTDHWVGTCWVGAYNPTSSNDQFVRAVATCMSPDDSYPDSEQD